MHAGQELRFLVAAIVDDRLLQAAKARSRIGGDVLDAGCLDDIDHKVRSRPADDFILGVRRLFRLAVSRGALRRRIRSCDLGADDCRRANRSTLQERTPVHTLLAHDLPPYIVGHLRDIRVEVSRFNNFMSTAKWQEYQAARGKVVVLAASRSYRTHRLTPRASCSGSIPICNYGLRTLLAAACAIKASASYCRRYPWATALFAAATTAAT